MRQRPRAAANVARHVTAATQTAATQTAAPSTSNEVAAKSVADPTTRSVAIMPTTAVATPLLVIATTSSAAAPAAVQEITQILSTRHHITDPLFQDFQVQTLGSRLTVFNQIITLPTDFVPAIAALSLLVGGIGVLNIMLVSVTDRTRGSAPARQSAPPTTWS